MKRFDPSVLIPLAILLLATLACGIPTAELPDLVTDDITEVTSSENAAQENSGFTASTSATPATPTESEEALLEAEEAVTDSVASGAIEEEIEEQVVVEEPAADSAAEEAVTSEEPAAETAEVVTNEQPTAAQIPPNAEMLLLEDRLIELYEQINPSVIHIFVFQENFPIGTGTGFIIDEEGHAVTNNHVVAQGDRFEVAFPGGERREATLTGSDVDSDLAVLRVEELPADAVPIPLGNSNELKVGQFVVAIGNPFGQESSMSLGIVSGLERSLRSQRILEGGGQYSLPQVIQTDAPINPGNSGGPLLNLEGEVVGVNAAIRSETGANTGVGFSIPVNAVSRIVPALIADGEYVYPYLGVSIFDAIDLNAQDVLGLPQTNGAYVTTVLPGGPADEAGIVGSGGNSLTGGDFIIAIDEQQVNEFGDLISYLVFETEVGQTVTLTIIRDGETIELPVEIGARP